MLRGEVLKLFALCLLCLAQGMPQDSQTGLPLIQFTNGGIRFNFAGYHAEAGLGGLLTGSRTGGGLHASAGTPWGAQAGAGLGGVLSGDNANTGGGLYARAGLGNGRPAAAAGLGGVLDGSGRSGSPGFGGLFAGATTGQRGVGVSTGTASRPAAPGTGSTPPQNGESNGEQKPTSGNSNIQIIAKKKAEKLHQVRKEEPEPAVPPVESDPPANKEVREVEHPQPAHTASASLYGAISANPVPQGVPNIQIEKTKFVQRAPLAPPVPPLPEANQVVIIEKHRKGHPKLVIRKRLWGPRKQVVVHSSINENPPTVNVQKRVSEDSDSDAAVSESKNVPYQSSNNNGFFDDVFNIPISTLNAVNQLLNNSSG